VGVSHRSKINLLANNPKKAAKSDVYFGDVMVPDITSNNDVMAVGAKGTCNTLDMVSKMADQQLQYVQQEDLNICINEAGACRHLSQIESKSG
jgi:hypothetical protein